MTDAPHALVLVGHGSRDPEGVAQYVRFARAVAARLAVPVYPCFLELADPPIAVALEQAVSQGATHVAVVPLFLGPAGHQKNDVPALLAWARATWPDVTFVYGTPLGPHGLLVEALADRVRCAERDTPTHVSADETAVLVVGRGSRDPDSNSDLFKVARLLWEGRDYRWVEVAFYSLTGPRVADGLARCVQLGARRVIVAPFLLFTGGIHKGTVAQAREAVARYPGVELLCADPLGDHEGVLAVVAQRYREALEGTAAMTCDLCKYRHRLTGFEHEHGQPQTSDHHHGLRGVDGVHVHHHHHHGGHHDHA